MKSLITSQPACTISSKQTSTIKLIITAHYIMHHIFINLRSMWWICAGSLQRTKFWWRFPNWTEFILWRSSNDIISYEIVIMFFGEMIYGVCIYFCLEADSIIFSRSPKICKKVYTSIRVISAICELFRFFLSNGSITMVRLWPFPLLRDMVLNVLKRKDMKFVVGSRACHVWITSHLIIMKKGKVIPKNWAFG